jgi:hypothetical protein
VTVAELSFAQTVFAGVVSAAATAVFVGLAAGLVVKIYETRAAESLRKATALHEEQLQTRQLEHEARTRLRDTYADLLVAQRRSREASVRLAHAGTSSNRPSLEAEALSSHDAFIDLYHQLILDASEEMWKEARGLRRVLDDMLRKATRAETTDCDALVEIARKARQNLERSFRVRLQYDPLQKRKPLGRYDRDLFGPDG